MTTELVIVICFFLLMLGAVAISKQWITKSMNEQALEATKASRTIVMPLRLQAYERMALFLERIDPNQLVLRIHAPGLTVAEEQNLLMTAIRSEYEHNISQQIYISNETWKGITDAMDDVITIITSVAEQMDSFEGMTYAEAILTVSAQKPIIPRAMQILKADMQRFF
ncbi:MAG: hypothetical protein IKR77_07285 [Bacteroidales bacterium]|nr:hypothetical protein [Bacteroidales bacterium]